MKNMLALFAFLFLVAACSPTPTPLAATVTPEPPTPAPTLSDSQFYELTGTVRINGVSEYQVGVLPYPAEVTLSDGEGVAVALAFMGEELPVDVTTFLTATVLDTHGRSYSASFAIEMGCWPQNVNDHLLKQAA